MQFGTASYSRFRRPSAGRGHRPSRVADWPCQHLETFAVSCCCWASSRGPSLSSSRRNAVAYFMATHRRAFGRSSIRSSGHPVLLHLALFLRRRPGHGAGCQTREVSRSTVPSSRAARAAVWMLAWPTMLQNLIAGSRAWSITPWWGTSLGTPARRDRRRDPDFHRRHRVFVISVFGREWVYWWPASGGQRPDR